MWRADCRIEIARLRWGVAGAFSAHAPASEGRNWGPLVVARLFLLVRPFEKDGRPRNYMARQPTRSLDDAVVDVAGGRGGTGQEKDKGREGERNMGARTLGDQIAT